MKSLASLLVQEGTHFPRARRMFEFPQGFSFNLSDAFAGYAELLANFLQRMIGVHADAEAHAQDALFAGGQAREDAGDRFLEVGLDRGVDRDDRILVLDEVAQ